MLLSEHVYCVAITFKMTEGVEQWICIKFCFKLEHSAAETIHMIQKATAMGNWWLALHQDNAPTHVSRLMPSVLVKDCIRLFSPCTAQIWCLWLLAFPQAKITFEGGEISGHQWNSGKYVGSADGNWENSVRSQGAYFEEDWGVIVLCTMSFLSCIFFN